jgi:hypothetical protein
MLIWNLWIEHCHRIDEHIKFWIQPRNHSIRVLAANITGVM